MMIISLIRTEVLIELVIPAFVVSFIFLAIVPIIGVEVKGARRWLNLYFFNSYF